MNYNFLAPELVIQLHDSILAITKGLPGVKEPELVEAVCSRVLNLAHYEGIDDVYTVLAAQGILTVDDIAAVLRTL